MGKKSLDGRFRMESFFIGLTELVKLVINAAFIHMFAPRVVVQFFFLSRVCQARKWLCSCEDDLGVEFSKERNGSGHFHHNHHCYTHCSTWPAIQLKLGCLNDGVRFEMFRLIPIFRNECSASSLRVAFNTFRIGRFGRSCLGQHAAGILASAILLASPSILRC